MDLLAAHQLKEALLVALWNRERNNMAGETVTISLIQAGVSALANQATGYLGAKHGYLVAGLILCFVLSREDCWMA